MEHRWGRRVAVDIPIQLTSADVLFMREAHLANLSITGAMIRADFRPRLLSRVQIVFGSSLTPEPDSPTIAAYVARNNRYGIGIEWCEVASPIVTELLRTAGAR